MSHETKYPKNKYDWYHGILFVIVLSQELIIVISFQINCALATIGKEYEGKSAHIWTQSKLSKEPLTCLDLDIFYA